MTVTRVLIWPDTVEGAAERDAYVAWSNLNAGIGAVDPPETWRPFQVTDDRRDAYGQPWCAMCEYQPDWSEPEGGPAERPNAVVHDTVVHPDVGEI